MKSLLQSKTIWFNLITIALGISAVFADAKLLDPNYLVLINGIGNVFLRFLTKEAIK